MFDYQMYEKVEQCFYCLMGRMTVINLRFKILPKMVLRHQIFKLQTIFVHLQNSPYNKVS